MPSLGMTSTATAKRTSSKLPLLWTCRLWTCRPDLRAISRTLEVPSSNRTARDQELTGPTWGVLPYASCLRALRASGAHNPIKLIEATSGDVVLDGHPRVPVSRVTISREDQRQGRGHPHRARPGGPCGHALRLGLDAVRGQGVDARGGRHDPPDDGDRRR